MNVRNNSACTIRSISTNKSVLTTRSPKHLISVLTDKIRINQNFVLKLVKILEHNLSNLFLKKTAMYQYSICIIKQEKSCQ